MTLPAIIAAAPEDTPTTDGIEDTPNVAISASALIIMVAVPNAAAANPTF